MPPLETARLLIRPFVLTDLDAIHQILDVESGDCGDDAVRLMQAKHQRQQWLAWSVLNYSALANLHQPPYGDRAIVLRASGELIGACGFAPVMLPFAQLPAFRPIGAAPADPARNTHEMGLYWEVSPRHQRRGYATEAATALIQYAFITLNLQRIVANTNYDNAASLGVMRKLGMAIQRNPLPEPPYLQIVGVLEYNSVLSGSGG
jgi:RimJ/RimL family protein N-acetyltransferase